MKYPVIVKNAFGDKFLCANKSDYYDFRLKIWDKHGGMDRLKNITAEYLANTYGEVKSKEHAEFIVKLAEVNDVKVWGDEFINNSTCAFVCYRGVLEIHNHKCNKTISRRNLKQIDIPLPLECESDEWPKVGEIVLTASKSKAKVLAIHNKKAWVEYVSGANGFNTLNIASLSKPKTPEQELRDFLHLLWCENNEDFDDFADIAVLHLAKKGEGDE